MALKGLQLLLIVDALLQRPDRLEVLLQLVLVRPAQLPLQGTGILLHQVQHALFPGLVALLGYRHHAPEKPVEGHARVYLPGAGLGGGFPGDAGGVEAREAGGAADAGVYPLHPVLQRVV